MHVLFIELKYLQAYLSTVSIFQFTLLLSSISTEVTEVRCFGTVWKKMPKNISYKHTTVAIIDSLYHDDYFIRILARTDESH